MQIVTIFCLLLVITENLLSQNAAIIINNTEKAPAFKNCVVKNCQSSGFYLKNSNPKIIGCLAANNNGSGIRCYNSSPEIINCTISGNCADKGAGLYLESGSSPQVMNSIFSNNTGNTGRNILINGINAKPLLSYNLIEGGENSIALENGAIFPSSFIENIYNSPLVIDTITYKLTNQSPCINTGNPDTSGINLPSYDFLGNIRIFNNRVDIGYNEYNSNPSNIDHLSQNSIIACSCYPNPFNNTCLIDIKIKNSDNVTLRIYNQNGQIVDQTHILVNNSNVKHSFNAQKLTSGIYICTITNGKEYKTTKLVLIK